MYPSPASGAFDRDGRYIGESQGLDSCYRTSYQDLGTPQSTSFAQLHWTQDRYLGVAVVVVHIGGVEVNQSIQKIPMVARVSVVDYRGYIVLDTYVRPTHKIEDYRSQETGIHPYDLINAPAFQDVQLHVARILTNKIIVGHSLWNFLSVMGLSHPAMHTRDLALFRPLRKKLKSRLIVSLPTLVHIYMGRNVGIEYEDSMEFARAAIDLFRCCERSFEKIIEDGAWPCNIPPSAFSEYFT